MKAVILAGGKGTRLAPYTTVFPKPLVPIGDKPILDLIVRQLAHYGFTDIVLNVGYLAELIRAYFQNAETRFPGVRLSYVSESEPTGTAGSLASVPGLAESFLVMNGDVLTGLDYRHLIHYHRQNGGALTIALHKRKSVTNFGVVETDGGNRIVNYIEKPEIEHSVSMGVYVYEPEILGFIEPGRYLDFPELVLRLLKAGKKVVAYPCTDYWLDIGRHDDYAQAQEEFAQVRHLLLPNERNG